ncbi:MAG: DNA internalization-related competence protein ComEC/Rec2 [Gammaproteobacteria bacterium]|nr:DNA internalization-related competence protein ComEC/Rec2 [Gammaproteobacteria bacterium]
MGLLSFCTLFLSGAYAIQLLQRLPADIWLYLAVPATGLCLLLKPLRPAGAFLFGFVLIWVSAHAAQLQKLAPSLAGADQEEVFQIIDFVDEKNSSIRIVVAPVGANELPKKIRLSWYDAPEMPVIGECWALKVRLRRPRGFSNPVGFDYEGWLFRQGIGATGYVREGVRAAECPRASALIRVRRQLVERLAAVLPDDDATAVMMAITVGARHKISSERWRQYAVTGTSHLMAISGLHIGLAAGGGFLLAWFLLALGNRCGNIHDQAAIMGLIVAGLYVAVSGFAVPALRALLMLLLVLLITLHRRPLNPMRILALTCIAMTMADPLSILTPGFQLSFAAVAILLWLARLHRVKNIDRRFRHRLQRGVRELVPLQIALLLGLLPLTVALFGRVSWLSPLVNLIALPVFNLVTVPASLLGLLFSGPFEAIGDVFLRIAWYSVSFLLSLIDFAARIPHAELRIATLDWLALAAVGFTMTWVILPAGWPGRKLAWLAALAAVLHVAPRPPADCVDIHALDVGQGLAIVVTTQTHTLVYDAGPSFRSGSDTGALVVAPFLRAKGIDDIDIVVVSHSDNDHAGGVRSLLAGSQVGEILVGERLADIAASQTLCEAGQRWQWDGVRFALLHPDGRQARTGNDASCVVEIRVGKHVALLTGDIELLTEQQLVRQRQLSTAELVMVPHHGSRTSSHAAFIAQLQPRIAIVSAGFENRWGFPKDDVVQRWQSVGTEVINTAYSGAVAYRMCAHSGLRLLTMHRPDNRRIWHD